MPPPRNRPIHIPTPKGCTQRNILHDTTWRDYECKDWIKNATGGWNLPPSFQDPIHEPIPPAPNIDNPTVNTTNVHQQTSPFHIRTTQIQSDMGANRCVSDNKSIMVNFQEIAPYAVGGVEKEEVAIVCTGKAFIPWYSEEGILNMVECLYSSQCDGTLISPTNVVDSNSDKYHSFTIESNCDNGTGTLKLIHRDGKTHDI